MTYDTTITTKGTITIAAPIRKHMSLKSGQKLTMSINTNNQIVIDPGTDMKTFETLRSSITKKIPDHLKGLSGEELQDAAGKAWVDGYRD